MIHSIQHSSQVFKIAITGPESTGKSTLAKALAAHYHTVWVEEYARTYIAGLSRPYEERDLLTIATKQVEKEHTMLKEANRILFCDTDLLVLKIWSMHKYNRIATEILDMCMNTTYDYSLLMDIDLPWQYDPQREHPDKRRFFFEWFQRELDHEKAPYSNISGSLTDRTNNAIRVIDQLLPDKYHSL